MPWRHAIAIIALAMLCVTCTKSTEHVAPSYQIVFSDAATARSIYIIDSEAREIVDSIPDVGYVIQMVPSPDGGWLYAVIVEDPRHSRGFYKFDLSTRELAAVSPAYGIFSIVDDGRTIIVGGVDSTYVIDSGTLTITSRRAVPMFQARGRPDADIVVGLSTAPSPAGRYSLAVYNFRSEAFDTIQVGTQYGLVDAFLHPDHHRVFVVAVTFQGAALLAVDLEHRKSTLITPLKSVLARVVFSSSGDTAYVSDPDNPDDPDIPGCPRGGLLCIDARPGAYTTLNHIATDAPVMDVALSPEGDLLYATQAYTVCEGGAWGNNVLVISTRTFTSIPEPIASPVVGQPRELVIVRRE